MKKYPLVSIITPTYNHERFIGQCIESVLNQTYSNWEQIIIDDGSTDRTYEIVARYKDRRIKCIRQENVGVYRLSETYNKALNMSQGELIAVLEGDDFWPVWKLEKQITDLHEQTVLSFGKAAVTNSAGIPLYITHKNFGWFKIRREEKIRKLLLYNFIPACTALCRKNALLSIGGFQHKERVPYVDFPTWLQLSMVGEIQAVDEILGYWRKHDKQATELMALEMSKAHVRCSIDFIKNMPSEIKDAIHLTPDDLIKKFRYETFAYICHSGRMKLFCKDWINARKDFRKAMTNGNLPTRIIALIGLTCSYMRFDLEWGVKLMGMPELSEFK